MSRALGLVERITRRYACPYCGAGNNGDPCVTRTGNRKSYSHSERWWAACNDKALPFQRIAETPPEEGP